VGKVRPLISELQQVYAGLAAHQAEAAAASGPSDTIGPDRSGQGGAGADEDVIDAEFDKG
ncbi:hypothetical protein AB0N14_40260, partial [Streptomyces sp. NPDC051104]|uniref:hypothetical protein n=1 Tax=Streptomyces sp. NPDC051104 TaxID=3155044 RepID=UPI00343E1CC9